jgi:hypothetical protein
MKFSMTGQEKDDLLIQMTVIWLYKDPQWQGNIFQVYWYFTIYRQYFSSVLVLHHLQAVLFLNIFKFSINILYNIL